MEFVYRFEGQSGVLELYKDRFVIIREGGFVKLYGYGEERREILLSDIDTVIFKKGGLIADGYFQIVLKSDRGSTQNPYKDKNSIVFSKNKNVTAEFVRDKIFELLDNR